MKMKKGKTSQGNELEREMKRKAQLWGLLHGKKKSERPQEIQGDNRPALRELNLEKGGKPAKKDAHAKIHGRPAKTRFSTTKNFS